MYEVVKNEYEFDLNEPGSTSALNRSFASQNSLNSGHGSESSLTYYSPSNKNLKTELKEIAELTKEMIG